MGIIFQSTVQVSLCLSLCCVCLSSSFRFCLTARKGAYGFLDALNSLIVDVGFVVEGGRDGADDELPEQILACSHISHLDPMNAKSLAFYIEAGKKARANRLKTQH